MAVVFFSVLDTACAKGPKESSAKETKNPKKETTTMTLPEPQTTGGIPLMQALAARRSERDIATEKLTPQQLSDLLWAAAGINREKNNLRTAPSTRNWQEIDVYLAMEDGLYLYNPKNHALTLVKKEDLRAQTGTQEFVKEVPLNLIYVADMKRVTGNVDEKNQILYTAADSAFMVQNVYLYCASNQLATVVRGAVERDPLAKAMGLDDTQRIILTQSVGHPKTK